MSQLQACVLIATMFGASTFAADAPAKACALIDSIADKYGFKR